MMNYTEIVCYHALLPTIILWILVRLLFNRFDKLKILVLSVFAIGVTVSSHFAYNERYHSETFSFSNIGPMHLEECLYVSLQVIITTICSIIFTRWSVHALYLKRPNTFTFYFIRYFGISVLVAVTVFGYAYGTSAVKRICFYFPFIACIWCVAGQYITRRFISTSASILVSALYFYHIDIVMVDNHIRSADGRTVLDFVLFGHSIYLEQLCHHLVFSALVVFASAAFDKAQAVLDIFYPREFLDLRTNRNFMRSLILNSKRMIKGLITDETEFPSFIIEDLEVSVNALHNLYPWMTYIFYFLSSGFVQDFAMMGSFCSALDDVIDSDVSIEVKREDFQVSRKFLDEVYQGYPSKMSDNWKRIFHSDYFTSPNNTIDWEYYEKKLTSKQLSLFRSFSRVVWYLPREYFDRLWEGFSFDIEKTCVLDEDELVEYARKVCHSPTCIAFIILWHKLCKWPDNFGPKIDEFLDKLGYLGMVFQFLDIAQDIIIDSKYGRCYIPVSYFTQNELKFITEEKDLTKIDDAVLAHCVKNILNLAKRMWKESTPAFEMLPRLFRGGFLSVLTVSLSEEEIKISSGVYKSSAGLSIIEKVLIIFKCLLFLHSPKLMGEKKHAD